MGCTQCTKRRGPDDGTGNKPNENGFKSLFYATTEFDLSRSDSEDEEEIYSLNSIKVKKQQPTKRTLPSSNILDSTKTNSSAMIDSVSNNQIVQTVHGHVIRSDNIDDLSKSAINFDLQDASLRDNVTYYSYHIHVYFLQKNENQTNEATLLRNRFLDQFNVESCNDDCETWCPSICHWDLNLAPIGPHPIGSWGIYLPLAQFTDAVSFISMYHGNLTILVHPNSGRPKIDHLLNAFWLKSSLPLDGDQLSDNAPPPPHRL